MSAVAMEEMPALLDRADESRFHELNQYSRAYDQLKGVLLAQPHLTDESRLGMIEGIATFAMDHHPGLFADGDVEREAIRIGERLAKAGARFRLSDLGVSPPKRAQDNRRKVLHVATDVWSVGGHSRTIKNWISIDSDSQHCLVLTRQIREVPAWIAEVIQRNGGHFFSLPYTATRLERAWAIREIAHSFADVVYLHHHQEDSIPLVAFAERGGPPVGIVNHADHVFWLGAAVADIIVDLREVGRKISDSRRAARKAAVLPIPLDESKPHSKEQARAELGIPADQFAILSVGRPIKYRPTETHNFFRTFHRVLEREKNAHLYVVGMNEQEGRENEYSLHPRIHLCGLLEDPSLYRQAADLYVDCFPWSSATSTLEAALAGLPVVLQHGPVDELLTTNHDLSELIENLPDEASYVDEVCRLADHRGERELLAAKLQQWIQQRATGAGWRQILERVYGETQGLSHSVRVPADCDKMQADVDVAICKWQALSSKNRHGQAGLTNTLRRVVFDVAFEARQNGDYRGAAALLRHALSKWGWDYRLAMSLAKLPIHWTMSRLRSQKSTTEGTA